MKILFIMLTAISFAKADTVVRSLTFPFDEVTRAQYSIQVTGDFPIYTAQLNAGREPVFYADDYLKLMALDVCLNQMGRVPQELNTYNNDKVPLVYKTEFKCVFRDMSESKDYVKNKCEKPADQYFQKLCFQLKL